MRGPANVHALIPAARLMIATIAEDVAGARAEHALADEVEHAALDRRELAHGHRIQIQQVQQRVDDDDADRPHQQRARHVASGIADLLGHVRRGVPSRIGEHHRNEREQPVRRADRRGRLLQVGARAHADRKSRPR